MLLFVLSQFLQFSTICDPQLYKFEVVYINRGKQDQVPFMIQQLFAIEVHVSVWYILYFIVLSVLSYKWFVSCYVKLVMRLFTLPSCFGFPDSPDLIRSAAIRRLEIWSNSFGKLIMVHLVMSVLINLSVSNFAPTQLNCLRDTLTVGVIP